MADGFFSFKKGLFSHRRHFVYIYIYNCMNEILTNLVLLVTPVVLLLNDTSIIWHGNRFGKRYTKMNIIQTNKT